NLVSHAAHSHTVIIPKTNIKNTFTSYIFYCNLTTTTQIYTLSLHDALPILQIAGWRQDLEEHGPARLSRDWQSHHPSLELRHRLDRKSTRLNSSHDQISYAVFCLKKKKIYQDKYTLNMNNHITENYFNLSHF